MKYAIVKQGRFHYNITIDGGYVIGSDGGKMTFFTQRGAKACIKRAIGFTKSQGHVVWEMELPVTYSTESRCSDGM